MEAYSRLIRVAASLLKADPLPSAEREDYARKTVGVASLCTNLAKAQDWLRVQAIEVRESAEALRAVLHRLESERDEARQVIAEQGASIDQLQAQLAEVEQERDQLMSRSEEIDSELHRLGPYSAITVAGQVAELVADYQKLKQDRDRLAAEVERTKTELASLEYAWDAVLCESHQQCGDLHDQHQKLGAGCLICTAQNFQQQLTAAQEENKRLEKVVTDIAQVLDNTQELNMCNFDIDDVAQLNNSHTEVYQIIHEALSGGGPTAAQESAQEQFRKGLERAAEICLAQEDGDKHFYVASKCARLIRAELSKGEGNER